jgi:hypothetical protein
MVIAAAHLVGSRDGILSARMTKPNKERRKTTYEQNHNEG